MTGSDWEAVEGASFPLGVSWVEKERAFNFAIYSKHAESVELLLYRDDELRRPAHVFRFDYLKNKSGTIWHQRITENLLRDIRYYAYRIKGPRPGPGFSWHTFDSEKLLLDPYSKAVYFPAEFDRDAAAQPGSNEGRAPLGVLTHFERPFDWGADQPLRHGSDLIIYELHVRGFTKSPTSNVSERNRGAFDGVVEKIPYLQELGVTAVELMPVFQFDPQEGNYWGYMPLNFFAPHHAYSDRADGLSPT